MKKTHRNNPSRKLPPKQKDEICLNFRREPGCYPVPERIFSSYQHDLDALRTVRGMEREFFCQEKENEEMVTSVAQNKRASKES